MTTQSIIILKKNQQRQHNRAFDVDPPTYRRATRRSTQMPEVQCFNKIFVIEYVERCYVRRKCILPAKINSRFNIFTLHATDFIYATHQ